MGRIIAVADGTILGTEILDSLGTNLVSDGIPRDLQFVTFLGDTKRGGRLPAGDFVRFQLNHNAR